MEKFIPYDKLSKKKQRELNAQKRGSWGGLNPVTRKPENPKAYNRRKAQKWSDGSDSVPLVFPYHNEHNIAGSPQRGEVFSLMFSRLVAVFPHFTAIHFANFSAKPSIASPAAQAL